MSSGSNNITSSTSTTSAEPARLRQSTIEKSLQSKTALTPAKGRKIEKIEDTASEIRGPHNCSETNIPLVAAKVNERIQFSLDRFVRNYVFDCSTTRGTTDRNGASSHCGGCESAHAALSCKLYDDIFIVVQDALKQTPYSQLNPAHKGYLDRRFELSENEIQNLDSNDPTVRSHTFDKLSSTMTAREKRLTFSGTDLDLQRAVVKENRKESNKFDSSIEPRLRSKEDELAASILNDQTNTPIKTTLKLQDEYRRLAETTCKSLKADWENLQSLQDAWNEMIAGQKALDSGITDAVFESYLLAVDRYLDAYLTRFQQPKPQGIPTLSNFERYLKDNQPLFTLKTLQRIRTQEQFELTRHHLLTPDDADEKFAEALRTTEGRLTEALYQLQNLNKGEGEIKTMLKYGYGKMDENGMVPTPNKEDLRDAYLSKIPRAGKSKKRDNSGDFI